MELGRVCGSCPLNRRAISILRSVGLRVGPGRFISVLNPSNDNGSALVGVVNYLSIPSGKSCVLSNRCISDYARSRLDRVEKGGVKFVFRRFGLLPRLATCRGIRVPLLCRGLAPTREGRQILEALTRMNLASHVRRGPARLSNNRRRQITVTHILTTRPSVVLTSRPANGLSSASNRRVVGVVGSLRSRNGAVILVARSVGITGRTRHGICIRSNVLARERTGW